MNNKLAIITVTINHDLLNDFFHSLKKQTSKDYQLFLVDVSEGSQPVDGSDLNLTIIPSDNRGYSYGVNQGIQKAIEEGFSEFCIINDDTFFEKNFVKNVLSSIDEHPKSIIGGKIYYAPGYEYHKSRYQKNDLGHVLWYAGGKIDWNHVFIKHKGVDEIDTGQYDKESEIDFITGCLISFDRSVIDTIGLWDERYFLYFEDADYCVRAKRAGLKLMYDPTLIIWHKVSQSTGGSGSKLHQKYQNKNRVHFGLKYAPLRTKMHLLKNYALSFLK